VLFVVWWEPLISVGRVTFLADALRYAGAESVLDTAQDWPRVNLEEVVRLQPDYLVFAAAHRETVERTLESLRERPGWRRLEAVTAGRVAVVSDAINRPAPRLVDAIEELARQLHPGAFAEKNETRNSKFETRPNRKQLRTVPAPSAPQRAAPSQSNGGHLSSFGEFRVSNFEFRFCTRAEAAVAKESARWRH